VVTQVASVPMACPDSTCPTTFNGIVYSGQPFSLTVTAKNGLATPNTTVNYNATTGLSKATTLSAWDALGSTTTQNPGSGSLTNNTILAARFIAGASPLLGTVGVTSGSTTVTGTGTLFLTQLAAADVINISGVNYVVSGITSNTSLTLTASYIAATAAGIAADVMPTYSFAVGPTSRTNIYIRAIDTDGVTSQRATSVEGGVQVVSGRIKISNAYGSEQLPLPLTATVQYWGGASTGYVTSTTDNVSTVTVAKITRSNCLGYLQTSGACNALGVVSSVVSVPAAPPPYGVFSIALAAPGAGKTGSEDLTVNTGGWPAWLLSTTGHATFGVYKGSSYFIYQRENY
jgi:MSHA biogenesis protein MshQ